LKDSPEQLLPPEFDQAARNAQLWSKRIGAATVAGAIAVALSYVTTAAWVIVALALAAQAMSFQRWWHYTNVMSAVGDKEVARLLSEDRIVVQALKRGGFRGFTARHPTTVGIGLSIVIFGIIIGVVFGRHHL